MEEDLFFCVTQFTLFGRLVGCYSEGCQQFLESPKASGTKMEGFLYLSFGYLGGGVSRPYIQLTGFFVPPF